MSDVLEMNNDEIFSTRGRCCALRQVYLEYFVSESRAN